MKSFYEKKEHKKWGKDYLFFIFFTKLCHSWEQYWLLKWERNTFVLGKHAMRNTLGLVGGGETVREALKNIVNCSNRSGFSRFGVAGTGRQADTGTGARWQPHQMLAIVEQRVPFYASPSAQFYLISTF